MHAAFLKDRIESDNGWGIAGERPRRDDLTLDETIGKDIQCTVDSSTERPVHTFKPGGIQHSFDKLSKTCQEKDLKISDKKPTATHF